MLRSANFTSHFYLLDLWVVAQEIRTGSADSAAAAPAEPRIPAGTGPTQTQGMAPYGWRRHRPWRTIPVKGKCRASMSPVTQLLSKTMDSDAEVPLEDAGGESNQDQEFYMVLINCYSSDLDITCPM